jgi:hypothetical protein
MRLRPDSSGEFSGVKIHDGNAFDKIDAGRVERPGRDRQVHRICFRQPHRAARPVELHFRASRDRLAQRRLNVIVSAASSSAIDHGRDLVEPPADGRMVDRERLAALQIAGLVDRDIERRRAQCRRRREVISIIGW